MELAGKSTVPGLNKVSHRPVAEATSSGQGWPCCHPPHYSGNELWLKRQCYRYRLSASLQRQNASIGHWRWGVCCTKTKNPSHWSLSRSAIVGWVLLKTRVMLCTFLSPAFWIMYAFHMSVALGPDACPAFHSAAQDSEVTSDRSVPNTEHSGSWVEASRASLRGQELMGYTWEAGKPLAGSLAALWPGKG